MLLVPVCRGICSTGMNDPVQKVLEPLLTKLAEGYLNIVSEREDCRKEFFGLRDFYRLDTCIPYSDRHSSTHINNIVLLYSVCILKSYQDALLVDRDNWGALSAI